MTLAISSQAPGLSGVDIGLLSIQQGEGFIDALLTIGHEEQAQILDDSVRGLVIGSELTAIHWPSIF